MPMTKWVVDLNLDGNELQNAVIQNLGTAPANPKAGQIWYDTSTNLIYFYDGSAAKAVGYLPIASDTVLGGVKVGSNLSINSTTGVLSVPDASTSTKGAIEIATDQEASTGTDEVRAINAKQLATKVSKNNDIVAGTSTKITYDAKGLVTGGTSLSESDIPALHLSKITDVTATAAEVNVLDGITASTTELNYVDGVTSSIQTQLDNKVDKNTAITAGTATKITYDTKGLVTAGGSLLASDIPDISATYVTNVRIGAANGVAGLGADGKVPSSQLPSYVDDIIELLTLSSTAPATCATGDKYYNSTSKLIYTATSTNTWGTTGETPDAGVIYVALDTNATYRWSGTDMINISNPISAASESTPGIAAIATQSEVNTGTNDTKIVTPLKLATYVSGIAKKFTATNGALTASGGVCTWTITNTLNTADVGIHVYEIATGAEVFTDNTVASGTITVKFNSTTDIAANTYKAVIIG